MGETVLEMEERNANNHQNESDKDKSLENEQIEKKSLQSLFMLTETDLDCDETLPMLAQAQNDASIRREKNPEDVQSTRGKTVLNDVKGGESIEINDVGEENNGKNAIEGKLFFSE